jgi:hypothetical protein
MMIEFEDRSEEEQRLLLRYLDAAKSQPAAHPSRPGCLWLLIGRLYSAYLRWRCRTARRRL